MKKVFSWVGLSSLALVSFMAADYPVPISTNTNTQQERSEACTISNSAFKSGEEMTYKLYYNWGVVWVAAGEVTFRVKDLGTQYQVSAHGSTYKSYEWFYKVNDKYDTWLDKQTMLPVVSIRDVQEGKYRLYDKITFDHAQGKAVSLRGKTKEQAMATEYAIDACMHDILSIVYYIRNVNFDQMRTGTDIPMKIFVDKKAWALKLRYLGKDDNKKIKGQGRFRAITFTPQVVEGFYFKQGTEMKIWATDDKNKIPLMIESPLTVGSVKAVLKNYKGLRHSMSAKVRDYNKDDDDPDLPD